MTPSEGCFGRVGKESRPWVQQGRLSGDEGYGTGLAGCDNFITENGVSAMAFHTAGKRIFLTG